MPIKERLRVFIKYKKISERTFCRECGLSETYINSMRVSIQPSKVQMIAVRFPDLNTGWLLTGEGEMLKDSNYNRNAKEHTEQLGIDSDLETGNISKGGLDRLIDILAKSIETKDAQIDKISSHAAELESNLKTMNQHLVAKDEQINRLITLLEKKYNIVQFYQIPQNLQRKKKYE